MAKLQILPLKNAKDARGDAFYVPQEVFEYMGSINEMHYVTIEPGAVRGNHYHRARKECIVLYYTDAWEFAWRFAAEKRTITQRFDGKGAVSITIDAQVIHAIKNTGHRPVHIVACSHTPPQPEDTVRVVIMG